MPLRASSHRGSPNSPRCSALAWYRCWLGLFPWVESGKQTRVAHMAALIRYRYTTQPTLQYVSWTPGTLEMARSREAPTFSIWLAMQCSSVAPNFPSACYLPTSRLPQVCHHAQACQFHGAGEEHVPLTPIYMVLMASPELPRDEETEEAEAEDEAEAGVRKSCTRSQSSGPSPFWNWLSN